MKKIFREMFFGNDSKVGGVIALSLIAFIGLGCFCKKDGFDFSNIGTKNTNTNTRPIFTSNTEDNSALPATTPRVVLTKANAAKGEKPSDEEMHQIVEQTLLDFNQALQTEDFTAFRANVSKPFRDQYTEEKFREGFATFISKKDAMNKVLTSITGMEPEYSSGPEVVRQAGTKVLKASGSYQTFPGMKFDLSFIPEKTDWKLLKIEVRVGMD